MENNLFGFRGNDGNFYDTNGEIIDINSLRKQKNKSKKSRHGGHTGKNNRSGGGSM